MIKILMGAFLCFLSIPFLWAGTIRVIAPAGGESLTLGSSFVIRWEATDVTGNFNVILMREGDFAGRIATRLPSSTRSFTWRIGELVSGSAEAGSGYKVRVAEAGGGGSLGQSNGTFSIVATSGPVIPSLEMRTAERIPCDYSVESLAFRDFRGYEVMMVNRELLFPYNGIATQGTAIIRIRWNRSPARPPDPPCDVPVEVGLRYLSDRSARRIILGSYNTGPLNRDGISQISVPFVIRAGEADDAEVNIDARLLPQRAGCDGNARNNSRAYNLTLRRYQSNHDLMVQILPGVTVRRLPYDPHHPRGQYIRFNASFRVRDFAKDLVEPVADVRCKWSVLRKYPNGNWGLTEAGAYGFTTVAAVDSSDWTTQAIEGVFWAPDNYWDTLQLVVEVDCDNRIHDINRENNRRDRSFRLYE